jgi:hypothetical protein
MKQNRQFVLLLSRAMLFSSRTVWPEFFALVSKIPKIYLPAQRDASKVVTVYPPSVVFIAPTAKVARV